MPLNALPQRILERIKYIDNFLKLLYPELDKVLSECSALDIGCGYGALTIPIAKRVKCIKGIDVHRLWLENALEWARREKISNIIFERKSIFEITEKDEYDIVIFCDVLEHIKEQENALSVVVRCLKPGGVFILTTNNKWWPIEGHTNLPFTSYLPKKLADKYVATMGWGKNFDGHYLLSYSQLVALLDKQPISYKFKPPYKPHRLLYKIGTKIVSAIPACWRFANVFQVVGKKKSY